MTNAKNRMTNLELLRVFLMFGIVFGHAFLWGGAKGNLLPGTMNYIVMSVLNILASLSVNCYVMLSGFFLIQSSFKISRIVKLWIQVAFYSVLIFAVGVALGIKSFSASALVKSLFPIFTKQYWFASEYFALYLLYPFINRVLNGLADSRLRRPPKT